MLPNKIDERKLGLKLPEQNEQEETRLTEPKQQPAITASSVFCYQ